MSADTILMTGATGYLGFFSSKKILETTQSNLVLWIRDPSRAEKLIQNLGEKYRTRIQLAFGDLKDPKPFKDIDPTTITHIVHNAAVTAFNVDEKTADEVNISGTKKILDFANLCKNLKRITLVSSIYSTGMRPGSIEEKFYKPEYSFANHYERSKWQQEELVQTEYKHLPWTILRVATILCDDETGKVTQHNAVQNTLKLLYYGLISIVPGVPKTPVYLVSGDYCVSAICASLEKLPNHQIYHVCPSKSESLTLAEIIDLAYESFQKDESFKQKRIMKPLHTDQQAFDALVKSVTQFGGSVLSQAVTSVSPFGKQLYIEKDVKNELLPKFCPEIKSPTYRELFSKACDELVKTKFQRKAIV